MPIERCKTGPITDMYVSWRIDKPGKKYGTKHAKVELRLERTPTESDVETLNNVQSIEVKTPDVVAVQFKDGKQLVLDGNSMPFYIGIKRRRRFFNGEFGLSWISEESAEKRSHLYSKR